MAVPAYGPVEQRALVEPAAAVDGGEEVQVPQRGRDEVLADADPLRRRPPRLLLRVHCSSSDGLQNLRFVSNQRQEGNNHEREGDRGRAIGVLQEHDRRVDLDSGSWHTALTLVQ